MSSPIHRLISAVILLGWLTPSVGALAMGLHLVSEHHGASGHHASHCGEHRHEIDDFVSLVNHGHHHDLDAEPDHRHDARFKGQAPAYRPATSLIAILPAPPALSVATPERSRLDRSHRRGPPTALFTAHCSLLL